MWALGAAVAIASAWGTYRLRPQTLRIVPPPPPNPFVDFTAHGPAVRVRGKILVANAAVLDDELFAYLMFGYLRSLFARDGYPSWLTYERDSKSLTYIIRVALEPDLIHGLSYLRTLQGTGSISDLAYRWASPDDIARYEEQSADFDSVYNFPARRSLELLPRSEVIGYLRRFIRFKAATDRRIRERIEPVPSQPTRPEAHRLAEDIVTIADFYELPLEFFLGIGAMENNYMNVRGDIGHSVWKRRAEKGDVVLRRGPKGVLILNESAGIWQITRETLRQAHRLFLADRRDYSRLPEHLRPPHEFNVDSVAPEVLTTYAGLLFRDLLDHFGGDVANAVGAYNGGKRNPNLRYESGVRRAAEHARQILERAGALRGRPVAETRFLTSARKHI